ncbi:putative bifunctional diguanylate cyclase/phosphodiesterase [Tateyamaria sp.]|uniref:putative bifunctional diguanylate cyclase/phosphodiesterase n=1 Tax=Tateyamaria sp. TaxID=1929288 RepID=UPI00329B5A86
MTDLQNRLREGSKKFSIRRYAVPVIVLCMLTGIILFGVSLLIERAVNSIIRTDAEHSASRWAEQFDAVLPDLESMLARGELTAEQQDVVDSATSYSGVFSFLVFDLDGMLAYSSDYGVVDSTEESNFDQSALDVAANEHPLFDIIQREQQSGLTSVYVHAYVPALNKDGTPMAVISLYLEKTRHADAFRTIMNWIGFALPLLSAALYAIPSIAFLAMREKAHARARRAARLSRFDQLTGALNRHSLSVESKQIFANRAADSLTGVIYLDVDKFKNVNDEFGHEFGDAFLRHIASTLKEHVRPFDFVGRMGGDEFVVTLPDIKHANMVHIGQQILFSARQPFEYNGMTIKSSVSMGYILADTNVKAKDALRAADLALYHAKSTGRDSLVEYFPELDTAMIRRREVEARMHEAVEKNEFETYFQPIVSPKDNSVLGFETLLRLQSRDGVPISPAEFIPIAEETGIIHDIGCLTLRNAMVTAKTWPDHIFISVNLSPAQFNRGTLVENVSNDLKEFDFPASRLELEVTEGLLMSDEQSVSDQLVGLKSLGVSIAMDDFGTGYSSLGYLWKYDFDKLKIDQIFLEGLDFDQDRYREIIETIIILGHKMGMSVTVEGVETQSQAGILDALNCDHYQGYLYGKPMPADETLAAIARLGSNKTSLTG